MENNYNKFRRAAFGGFNREDVINYIEKMKNEFFDYKKEVELTVSQLNSKIRELESAYEAISVSADENIRTDCEPLREETNPVSDINEATRKLRNVADELCRSLSDFMFKVSENAVSVVIENIQDEAPQELVCEEAEIPQVVIEEKGDRVAEILKATSSFSCDCNCSDENVEEKECVVPEKKNILDILDKASFLK